MYAAAVEHNTAVANSNVDALEDTLRVLNILKTTLQQLVTLANNFGSQASAHEYSRQLGEVLALEFRLNPHARRTKRCA